MRNHDIKESLSKATAIIGLIVFSVWLYFKLDIAITAEATYTVWNDKGDHYINTYPSNYSKYKAPGRLIGWFSSRYFFRVYKKDGTLLRSSEWMLWEREVGNLEGPYWIDDRVFYLTTDGIKEWHIR